MDSSAHTHLKVDFPLMVVAQDEQERIGLLCQLFYNHAFEPIPGKKFVAHIGRRNINKELTEILERDQWEYIDTVGFCQDVIKDIYSDTEGDRCFLILDPEEVDLIGKDDELARLLINDCLTKYNITPVLLSESLFHRSGGKQECRRLALHCGYVFLFGDDPVVYQGRTNEKFVQEFAAGLYPEPRNTVPRAELVDAFLELVRMNRDDDCGETYKSFLFVDRSRDDNMIKVYVKKHLEHRPRPPVVEQLPDVADVRRSGWASDVWYRTEPLEGPEEYMMYRRKRGIPLPTDFDTDMKWHTVIMNTTTHEDVHKLASYIRQLPDMTQANKETLLTNMLGDVARECPNLSDEVFYVEHNELHSHCII